uniref:THAP-type domain-containing protein n=1 Tax=Ciona savignyi TaxID=51511 RepID=H2Z4S2_CIOSA
MGCCSAPNCKNRTEKGFKMYRFPTDSTLKRIWLRNCRRANWMPTTSSRLCQVHFDNSQFKTRRTNSLKKLISGAIPTIFNKYSKPKRQSLKRSIDDKNSCLIDHDHQYSKPEKEAVTETEGNEHSSTLDIKYDIIAEQSETKDTQEDCVNCSALKLQNMHLQWEVSILKAKLENMSENFHKFLHVEAQVKALSR